MKTQSGTVLNLLAVALVCFGFRTSAIAINIPISNIVNNGGFETGGFPPWTLGGNTGGGGSSTSVPNNGAFGVDQDSAHSGDFGAFAGPSGSLGFLKQNLSTVEGSSYELSFFMNEGGSEAFSNGSCHPVDFQVYWNGALIFKTFNPPGSYTQFTFTNLLATGSSTILKFGFRDDFGFFHLDDVSAGITAVPETFSTFWLALPVIGMISFFQLRRKRA